jgi:hypothetical protein
MIASSVTMGAKKENATTSQIALDGYRAAFWMCFATALVSCVVSSVGLRKSRKVGLKRE